MLRRYGAIIVEDRRALSDETPSKGYIQLVTSPFTGIGACLALLGIAIGLTQYGFQQWIPTNLQEMGFGAIGASAILRDAAFVGLPLTLPLAYFYGRRSSRWTIVVLAVLNIISVAGFAITGNRTAYPQAILVILLVIPIWSINGLAGVLAAYAVEVYPTRIRARGGSLSAGATKLGGVLILALAAAAVTAPSIRTTAVAGLIPMVLAVSLLLAYGPETRRRSLEHIAKIRLGTKASSGIRR